MSKSNAVARRVVETGVSDPYDAANPDNQLSNQRPNALALARKTEVGRIVLAEDSPFMLLAAAAGYNAPAMALELASVAAKNHDIMRCTSTSIAAFMMDAAKLNLRIGRGIFPVAIPHKKDTPQEEWRLDGWVGYKGAKELACRGGAIRDAWATVVFEGDEFEHEEAPIPTVTKHRFGPNKGDMSKAIKVYCTLLYPGGRTRSRVFDRAKIESYRKRNPTNTWKTSPWKTAEEEMWQAKAILHTVGDLPHSSPEIAQLRAFLDREEQEALWQSAPAPALPAATHPAEGPEDLDLPADDPQPEEQPKAEPTPEQRLRAAHSVFITFRDGRSRMLSEIRNAQLEKLLTHFRDKLQEQPDHEDFIAKATAIAYVLEARKDGRSTEPLAQPEV